MRESPLYQEIIEEGIQKGEVTLTLRQLTRRLGAVSPQLQAQIQQLSRTQVEALGEALLDFSSTEDLVAWLQQEQ